MNLGDGRAEQFRPDYMGTDEEPFEACEGSDGDGHGSINAAEVSAKLRAFMEAGEDQILRCGSRATLGVRREGR
eukprot:12221744-Alexandrium_andersonii.AAC.1